MGSHLMDRISPKGGPFVGACRWCATEGPMELVKEKCKGAPDSQADNVFAAIGGRPV